ARGRPAPLRGCPAAGAAGGPGRRRGAGVQPCLPRARLGGRRRRPRPRPGPRLREGHAGPRVRRAASRGDPATLRRGARGAAGTRSAHRRREGRTVTTLMAIAGVLVAAATALVLARIILGPTTHDRLVGLDTVTALIVCGVVIHSAHTGEVDNTTLLVLL